LHGGLVPAQDEAERARKDLAGRDDRWAIQFQLLEAEILIWRGLNREAISLLNFRSLPTEDTVRQDLLLGIAYARLGRWAESDQSLDEAQGLCHSACALSGELLRARGVVAVQRGDLGLARECFLGTLQFARRARDRFLETTALSNLGVVAMRQEHYDESIDWTLDVQVLAHAIDAKLQEEKAFGNLGWDYYKMGDLEKALASYGAADKLALELGADADRVLWLSTAGNLYMDMGRTSEAEDYYKIALRAVQGTDNVERKSVLAFSLAMISLQKGELEQTAKYIDQAIQSSRAAHVRVDELYAILASGEFDVASSRIPAAEAKFQEVSRAKDSDGYLRWESENQIAQLCERKRLFGDAETHYRKALRRFEGARSELQGAEHRLPFLTNGSQLYGHYIDFLLARGRIASALQLADYGRAQTLAEGLGISQKDQRAFRDASTPEETAREIGGIILFYRLGSNHSYLWAVRPNGIDLFTLPSAMVIEDTVRRYRNSILKLRDVLETESSGGSQLYQMLIAPARHLIPRGAKVVIVPDASLHDLNFETLLVPEPKPHFWIDDVSVVDTYSLRLLGAKRAAAGASPGSMLLLGDPVVADPAYPELRNASAEISDIGKHFSGSKLRVLSRDQATPGAYFQNEPQRFDYIHFAAHGTASRVDPLDSAIVLSETVGQDQAFKLYAREIISRPLNASLVTISTCYGAGTRTYSGEGLVGLAWAFLGAGAHNVIGALWPVSDDSTPSLMDGFYGALNQGEPPLAALRKAKLAMLHSQGPYRKPFYWAPFQLYVGPQPGGHLTKNVNSVILTRRGAVRSN